VSKSCRQSCSVRRPFRPFRPLRLLWLLRVSPVSISVRSPSVSPLAVHPSIRPSVRPSVRRPSVRTAVPRLSGGASAVRVITYGAPSSVMVLAAFSWSRMTALTIAAAATAPAAAGAARRCSVPVLPALRGRHRLGTAVLGASPASIRFHPTADAASRRDRLRSAVRGTLSMPLPAVAAGLHACRGRHPPLEPLQRHGLQNETSATRLFLVQLRNPTPAIAAAAAPAPAPTASTAAAAAASASSCSSYSCSYSHPSTNPGYHTQLVLQPSEPAVTSLTHPPVHPSTAPRSAKMASENASGSSPSLPFV